jgi:hypothetical protein
MAVTLLGTAMGTRAIIHDSLWKTQKRHGMRGVRDVDSARAFVNIARTPAFEQQDNGLWTFMLDRNYEDDDIEDYLTNGLLVRVTTLTYSFYICPMTTQRNGVRAGMCDVDLPLEEDYDVSIQEGADTQHVHVLV